MWKTVTVAAAVTLEVSIPLNLLRAEPGDPVSFQLLVHQQQGESRVEVQRLPPRGPVELHVPAADWPARHWRV